LIIGIDPGNTSAVAGFNFNGELELLESRKEFPSDEIIRRIIETGLPVVVASDRKNMPSTVEKIAQSVGARKFEPSEDLSTGRKEKMGEGDNSHEIDAYASGLYAYNSLRRNIRKVKKLSEKSDKDLEEVARRYFSSNRLGDNLQEQK